MSPILTDGFSRYLFIGREAMHTLTMLGRKKSMDPTDRSPLETLFPRLVVVFFRECEPDNRTYARARAGPQSSPPRPPSMFNATRVRADVYRPITPSCLMSVFVIGPHLRETSIAGTVVQEALPDSTDDKNIENLYKIAFRPGGRFLPQTERKVFDVPGRVGDHPGIEVDPTTLDNDYSLGSRSRDIARGIFDLLPPRSVGLGEHSILPKIKVAGKGVAFKPLFSEVSSVFFCRRAAL
jgi:hypothetical protein